MKEVTFEKPVLCEQVLNDEAKYRVTQNESQGTPFERLVSAIGGDTLNEFKVKKEVANLKKQMCEKCMAPRAIIDGKVIVDESPTRKIGDGCSGKTCRIIDDLDWDRHY